MSILLQFRFVALVFVAVAESGLPGQETKLNTTPLHPMPQASSERLGTGVPSRRPKAEGQRPVYTIQSGGPAALPSAQFRPIRVTTPSKPSDNDAKNSLLSIELTRPWQKAGSDINTLREGSTDNLPQKKVFPPNNSPSQFRTSTQYPVWPTPRTVLPPSSPEPRLTPHSGSKAKGTPPAGSQIPAPLP